MKVKELKKLLDKLPSRMDDHDVVVWLPGSRIELSGSVRGHGISAKEVLIEGNLRPGSAGEQGVFAQKQVEQP